MGTSGTTGDKVMYYDWNNIGAIIVRDSDYTDAASFKTAMSGVKLLYELATPLTYEYDEVQTDLQVFDGGTESLVGDETSTPIVADIAYSLDYVDTIEANKAELADHETRITTLEGEVNPAVEVSTQAWAAVMASIWGIAPTSVGMVDLGSLTWGKGGTTYPRFTAPLATAKMPSSATVVANILCSTYTSKDANSIGSGSADICVALHESQVWVRDSAKVSYDASTFKTAMVGIYIFYEKA